MKGRGTIVTEGVLYVIIAAGTPIAEFLISDRPITQRAVAAISVGATIAAANALKAFLSQSMRSAEPQSVIVDNPPNQPANVQEIKP